MIDVWARLHATAEELPLAPFYNNMGPQDGPEHGRVLLPNGPVLHLRCPLEGDRFNGDQVKAIKEKRLAWFFYGLVRYVDFDDRLHESQFCYVYYVPDGSEIVTVPEGWMYGGYLEYNKHT